MSHTSSFTTTMTPTIAPTTTGKVFELSNHQHLLLGALPTNELPIDDEFTAFWLDFRRKIILPTQCEALLTSYVSVYSGDTSWADGLSHIDRAVRVQAIADMIRDTPPDVAIIDSPHPNGFHLRQPDHLPYIFISKYWVDQWKLAVAFDRNRRLALALEAVLRATIVHELAHWFFALVSITPDFRIQYIYGV